MILGGQNVDIFLVLIGFSEKYFFRECVFVFVFFGKENWKKSGQR